MKGTRSTRPSRKASMARPTSPVFVFATSRMTLRSPVTGTGGVAISSSPEGLHAWIEEAVDEIEEDHGEGERCHGRRGRGAEDVPAQDGFLRKPSRSGGVYVVFVHDLKDQVAGCVRPSSEG